MLEIIIYSAIIGIIGGGCIAAGAARMFHAPEIQSMGAFRTLGELNACNGDRTGLLLFIRSVCGGYRFPDAGRHASYCTELGRGASAGKE